MNITPLEIRQKEFEKNFRGFDKDEVKAFLNSLSIEWEKLNDVNKELKFKLEAAQEEVKKLREVENSLFKTLKTAEDTGANMIEQATRTAELHMRETEMKADALMSEAKSRAKSIIEDAEDKARMIVDDMEDEIRQLEQVFRSMDANKSSLISDLKMLAEDILSKIGRHEDFPADIKPHLKKAKELAREVNDNVAPVDVNKIIAHNEKKEAEASIDEMVEDSDDEETIEMVEDIDEAPVAETPQEEKVKEPEAKKEPKKEEVMEDASDNKEKGSFFDQFD
ncbi:DivIVA domain-containing protein [Roseivirga sp.]|uniref:DivIVA domain-containing protein n=1 Tax=Roseivirga sp. TaxID=1964215 RepID=UPI003B5180F4